MSELHLSSLRPTYSASIALIASVLLHVLIFFVLNFWFAWFTPEWTSQSKGQAQLILIAPSPEQETPQTGEEKNRPQLRDSQSLAEPTQEKSSDAKQAAQEQSQESSTLPAKASEAQTASVKQVTATQGDNAPIDTQTTTQQTLSPYEQQVFNHLLSKMDSTPTGGHAKLQLTIMSAGVAFDVNVLEFSTEQYGNWIRKIALSANPYPAFKPTARESANRVVVISINHQTVD